MSKGTQNAVISFVGCAVAGLLIGLVLFIAIAFLGMSIGSMLTGALVVAVMTFILYAVISINRVGKKYLIAPMFSAVALLSVGISEAGAVAAETWYIFAGTVLASGCAGAYVGCRLRSNSR